MKTLLKLEELFLLLFSIYLFSLLDYAWWWFPLLFFTPDFGMIGYLINPRVGAITYNLAHHLAVALSLYLIGALFESQLSQLVGIIMLGHTALDRMLGYGLKYPDAFNHTHLGMIGKAKA